MMNNKVKIAFAFVPDGLVEEVRRHLSSEPAVVEILDDRSLSDSDLRFNCNILVVDYSREMGEAERLIRSVRNSSRLIRIIIITPIDQIQILERNFSLYDDYLNKPFRPEHLVYKIRLNIRLLGLLMSISKDAAHFELLSDITSRLGRSENFFDALHLVAKRLADYLNVMRCSIVLVSEEGGDMIMVSTSDNERLFKMPLRLEKYPEIREMIRTRRPFEISNVERSAILRDFNKNLKEAGVRYICLIPINDIDEFIGVIFIRDRNERNLPVLELDFLALVGEIIGIFFNNSRFLSEIKSTSLHLASEIESMELTLLRLREDRDFLNDLIQDAIEGIIITNFDGQILVFNKTTEKVLGFVSTEVVEKMRIQDLLPQDYAEDIIDEFNSKRFGSRATISMGKKFFVSKGREAIPVMLTARVVGKSQDFMGIIWQFVDMREVINAQEKLQELSENLEMARKKAFAAALAGTAAHEMNQPLQSIMGYVELLIRRTKEGTMEHKYLVTINQECERMAQIIRNIANLTKYKIREYVGSAKIIDIDDEEGEKE